MKNATEIDINAVGSSYLTLTMNSNWHEVILTTVGESEFRLRFMDLEINGYHITEHPYCAHNGLIDCISKVGGDCVAVYELTEEEFNMHILLGEL